ncbi:hypothetical protein QFZ23_000381 [Arthrobacter globiformis]|nr:hypothetical protein [Arthrobacter globiformis]MDQ1056480.1 hypothetical protein [Arthrobacter globiformis]
MSELTAIAMGCTLTRRQGDPAGEYHAEAGSGCYRRRHGGL